LRKFEDWHAKGKLEETSLYLERSVVERPFPIPVSSSVDESNQAHFDVLVLANLAIDTDWVLSVYKATKKLSAAGKKVAFLHLPGLQRPTQQPSETFEQLLVETDAIRIYTENDCQAEQVWMQASSLSARNILLPQMRANQSASVIIDDANLQVNLDSAVALAEEYVGIKPTLHVADRECKLAAETWIGKARPAAKMWKPDSI